MNYTIFGSNNALNPLEKKEKGIPENVGSQADIWDLIFNGPLTKRACEAFVFQAKKNFKIVQVFQGKELGKLLGTYW